MSLNNEYRFGALPTMKWPRTLYKMKKNWKGTFNVGDLIPFYVQQQILPIDTYEITQSLVARMLTPIQPTMDDLVLDIYYFSCPYRLVWNNFKKFMGENTSGAWVQTSDLEIPQIEVKSTNTGNNIPDKNSTWCYMGLPINIKGADNNNPVSVSALPFRAYCEIYNHFFRNQNLIAPIQTPKDDSNRTYQSTGEVQYHSGHTILKASKLPDYYSTSLPEPQKAPSGAIKLPIGTSAPIRFGESLWGSSASDADLKGLPVEYSKTGLLVSTEKPLIGISQTTVGDVVTTTNVEQADNKQNSLYADLTEATAATINALRLSVQTQKIYEIDGTFGTRYFDEILYGHFGSTSGAAKYEKPLFLGAKRIPIVMNQVAQTADTSNAPLGQTGAFSLTVDKGRIFKASFTEHSILMGIMVIRQLTHTTQQGIPRQWSMKKRLDLFWHEYEHLGNQPVYNKEIYADGSPTDNEVFGYQERYAEYRYEENVICGELKSTNSTPLDSWHYGDIYDSLPVLSKSWIEETKNNVQRTLAVQNHDQFIVDTTMYIKATRPIKAYGTPGLVDHL